MVSSVIPKVKDSILSFYESEACLLGVTDGHMTLLLGCWLTGPMGTMLSCTGRWDAGRVRHAFDPDSISDLLQRVLRVILVHKALRLLVSDPVYTELSPMKTRWRQCTFQQNLKDNGTKLIIQKRPRGILPIGRVLFCRLRLRRVFYFNVSTTLLGDAGITCCSVDHIFRIRVKDLEVRLLLEDSSALLEKR